MRLSIDGRVLRIELEGFEKVLAFKGSLKIQLEQIAKATTKKPESSWTDLIIQTSR